MAVVARQQKPYVNAVMRARLHAMTAVVAFTLVWDKVNEDPKSFLS